jgi:transcriptional regulator with XRE-family HTH domain
MSKHLIKGKRLEEYYLSKHISKAEFARRMNIFPQDVNKYFTGILDPLNLTAQLIEDGCNIIWLATGKGEMDIECVMFKELREENLQLKQENEKLRNALAPALVETLLAPLQGMRRRKKQ